MLPVIFPFIKLLKIVCSLPGAVVNRLCSWCLVLLWELFFSLAVVVMYVIKDSCLLVGAVVFGLKEL